MGNRTDKLDPEKLNRIISEAAKEFSSYGYEGASLNRILAAAGVSKGYAYYYFVDKADLFALIVKNYWDQMYQFVDFTPADLTPENYWDRLFSLYLNSSMITLENPWMLGFARALWSLPYAVKQRGDVIEVMNRYQGFLKDVVKRGQELGLVRDDLPVALIVLLATAVEEVFDRWVSELDEEKLEDTMEQLVRDGMDLVKRICQKRFC